MSMASDDHFYASEGQYALWTEYMKQMGNASFFERLYRMEDRGDTPILEIDLDLPDCETEEIFIRKMNPRLEYISTTASYGRGSRTAGEITMAGVTKGEGIRRAVAMLSGDMKDTYGFGDSMNDASMLKACAVGVCMGNGADELKQIADYVTDDINENGLANAFRKFGII
jgi:hydroxymethylpyrimidine pyrophosphatase-like HAD family hydrolase